MWPPGSADTVCYCPPLTLTLDRLTLKLICESHLRLGNLPYKFGHARPLGSRTICYVRDGRTDRRTGGEKSKAYCPLPCGQGHDNRQMYRAPYTYAYRRLTELQFRLRGDSSAEFVNDLVIILNVDRDLCERRAQ